MGTPARALALLTTILLVGCAAGGPADGRPSTITRLQRLKGGPRAYWEERLGQVVTVEGVAYNARLGAMVDADAGPIWIDGIMRWPDALWHQRIRATGTVGKRHDLPVGAITADLRAEKRGVTTPEGLSAGTPLYEESTRYVLEDATCEIIQ